MWDRDGEGQVTDVLCHTMRVGNCPGMSKDLFDPILAPLVSHELENAHGEGSGGTFSLGISAQGLLVSSVEPEE